MRKTLLIILLAITFSCTEKSKKKTPEIQTIDDESSKLEQVKLDTLIDMEPFILDSLNRYGGGDCSGSLYQYSSPEIVLAIDSMTCGEYSFNLRSYQFKDEKLSLLHHKRAEVLIQGDTHSFVLTENIYDFGQEEAFIYTRSDTLDDSNLDALKAISLKKSKLKKANKTKEDFTKEYYNLWQEGEEGD